uniref:Enah/Vasp-like b n=1 Tax=Iconisemion striatum TaxID=60296 RepID=A0A1A7YDY3_9TELE
MSEQSICQARASVMVYDDTSKKWVPIKPGQQGFSRNNSNNNSNSSNNSNNNSNSSNNSNNNSNSSSSNSSRCRHTWSESDGGSSQGDEAPAPTGLAAMIAGAKLRRVQRPEESSSGAKNDANRTSGGSGGLMEEMNALLARRKAASEKPEDSQNDDPNSPSPSTRSGQNSTDGVKKPWDRANSADRSMVSRVRNAGSGGDTDSLDMDRMKQEILDEVFRELHKVKDEIIDALRLELSRVSTT